MYEVFTGRSSPSCIIVGFSFLIEHVDGLWFHMSHEATIVGVVDTRRIILRNRKSDFSFLNLKDLLAYDD